MWNMRNVAVFQSLSPNVMICGLKGISLFKKYMELKHAKKTNMLYALVKTSLSADGFLDGASSNNLCGCGMILILNKDHYFSLKLGGGIGTNTKDELLSL